MRSEWELEDLIECWTLDEAEAEVEPDDDLEAAIARLAVDR